MNKETIEAILTLKSRKESFKKFSFYSSEIIEVDVKNELKNIDIILKDTSVITSSSIMNERLKIFEMKFGNIDTVYYALKKYLTSYINFLFRYEFNEFNMNLSIDHTIFKVIEKVNCIEYENKGTIYRYAAVVCRNEYLRLIKNDKLFVSEIIEEQYDYMYDIIESKIENIDTLSIYNNCDNYRDKEIIEMQYYEDLDYIQMSKKLNKNLNTTKSMIRNVKYYIYRDIQEIYLKELSKIDYYDC